MILWLSGAYVVKKFSLIDLRVVGALQGAMATESSIVKTLRGAGSSGHFSPFGMNVGAHVVALLSSRESATKKTFKNINPLMLDFLKNLEVLKHSSSIPFAYFK